MESIVVRQLTKKYRNLTAVNGISFTIKQGEIFGMLGPNGAGKTTTVEILVGLRSADAGEIRVLGFDPAAHKEKLHQKIGVQLQMPALFPRLTVGESLKLHASFYPAPFPVDQVLEWIGLADRVKTQTYKLSGGQLQRLAVGTAMISNGDIIFLDEPTTGLDPQARRQMWAVIGQLKAMGKTIFLTTHYMEEAQYLCDRVAIIDHGSIIALGTPEQLISEHFAEKAIELPQVLAEHKESLLNLPGVTRIQADGDKITLYAAQVEAAIRELIQREAAGVLTLSGLSVRSASLEDVFLKLTGRSMRQ